MDKIVIVGTPFFSYTQSVHSAFVKAGYKSICFTFPKQKAVIGKIPILKYFFNMWFHIKNQGLFLKLVNAVERGDTVLFFGINYFSKNKLNALKKRYNLKYILWFIDSIYSFQPFYDILDIADIVFTYNKHEVDDVKGGNAKVLFMPLMCDSQFYYPKSLPKTVDLYFIGSLSKRIEFFEKLLSEIDKYQLNIIIDGTYSKHKLKLRKKKHPYFYKYYRGEKLSASEINEMYNKTKLCINLQPSQAKSALNIRTFEIAGSGALQITNGNKQIINELFSTENEILYFNDISDLASKIVVVNNNYSKYETYREAAYNRVINEHTTDMRVKTIINELNKL
ncbi:MAG: glycosyltransferase [Bacteroidales bacterium]|jgi:spore maturation protein CgeB|nr:glycosyltransferase [Bacteroidales bacterium]